MPKSKILPIKADEFADMPTSNVLGTYEGECADASITNKNGLDITRPVWETVFESEDYKQAIQLGWYIGFLGHPEDPNCMDFRNACIVMREGRIADNGKIYGKFDLIDTPVGRVVKAFQDAGVVFGISVRGAGDIVDNSVDPETFVFRGFDLVTFPAYPEAIPTFTKIAASTDADSRQKYQRVCAAIKENIRDINSASSLDLIQSQLAAQSNEYAAVEARKQELQCDDKDDLIDEKVEAVTRLYLDQVAACKQLRRELKTLSASSDRKVRRIKAIMSSQLSDVIAENKSLQAKHQTATTANQRLKSEAISLNNKNLKYKQEVGSTKQQVVATERSLRAAQSKLSETVRELEAERTKTSNLGAEASSLRKQLVAASAQLSEYKTAYASIYAKAVGADIDAVPIKSATSVADLQRIIGSSVVSSTVTDLDEVESEIYCCDLDDPDDLVTL